jgi:hypothetical protein
MSVGIGGTEHVSSIILDMFWIIWSISIHTCCHWFCGNIVLFCKVVISCRIWSVFVSENLMQNLLMFYSGMGFSILGVLLFGVGVCFFAMMLLGGMSRHIGK